MLFIASIMSSTVTRSRSATASECVSFRSTLPRSSLEWSATGAQRATKGLLPSGSRVRLFAEPATDRVDQYGRLLRYVVRVNGAVNVNVRLVTIGAAAPYFYKGRRGRYANRLEFLAKRARARKLGLWKACPRTIYDPYHGVQTRR